LLELGFDLEEAFVGEGLAFSSVGMDLGAVNTDVADLEQAIC